MSQNITELSWTEIDELDKNKTVMMIGMAPIEQHGKHLPTGVDIFETEYWMHKSINKLENIFSDYTFLTMPIIPFGHASLKGFPGTILLSQKTIYTIVLELLHAIAEWGIEHIIIISGHADPKHLIAIEQACDKINKKYGNIAFAPMGSIFSENPVNLEPSTHSEMHKKLKDFPNDFHAGWIETSNMLDISPEKVNTNFAEMPSIEIKPEQMIIPKVMNKKIEGYGHLGYPKEASKKLGQQLNEDMIQQITTCVQAFILKKNYEKYQHHELYKIPFLKVKTWRWK